MQCADALTNIECSLNYNMMTYQSCPTQIRHLLLADLLGMATPRLIPL